jgi:hypothetical protein
MIEHSIRCVRCGYALAGLGDEERCPECALPIADSRVPWSRDDAQRYLRRMRRGTDALLLGFAAPFTFVFAAIMESLMLGWVIAMAMGCGWCAGWWLVSGVPPRWLAFPAERYRGVLRALTALQFVCGAAGGVLVLGELSGYNTVTNLVNTQGPVLLLLFGAGFLLPAPVAWCLGFLLLRGFAATVLASESLANWWRVMAMLPLVCLAALFIEAVPLIAIPFAILGTASMLVLRIRIGRMIVPEA